MSEKNTEERSKVCDDKDKPIPILRVISADLQADVLELLDYYRRLTGISMKEYPNKARTHEDFSGRYENEQ